MADSLVSYGATRKDLLRDSVVFCHFSKRRGEGGDSRSIVHDFCEDVEDADSESPVDLR